MKPGVSTADPATAGRQPDRLKVLMLTRRPAQNHGGVERVVAGLVPGLVGARPGWEVEVVSAFAGPGLLEGFDGVSDVIAAWRLGRALAASDADVVLVHCPECVWGLRLLASAERLRRTVVVWHGAGPVPYLVLRPEGHLLARALAWFRTREERRALALGHHVAVHDAVVDELAAAYGHRGHVTTIQNAIDTAGPPPVPAVRQGRPFTAVWVGQADLRKGLDVALAAVQLARASVPDLELLVVGVPPGAAREGVRWLGIVAPDTVRDVYAQADLLLFPTRYESYGLVVVEAMAAGLPVVVSDAVPRGIVVDGANGSVVVGHDPAAYAAALVGFASDPERLRRVAEHNRHDLERFSLAVAVRAWVALVEVVAAGEPG